MHTGDIQEAKVHIDRAIALYDPTKHRQLATRFGQDVRVALWFYRSLAMWPLGYPEGRLQTPTARSKTRANSAKLPV
jgi:hypothetical protein